MLEGKERKGSSPRPEIKWANVPDIRSGLFLPVKERKEGSTGSEVVPVAQGSKIIIPTDKELFTYGKKDAERSDTLRTSTEHAVSLFAPKQFLQREIDKHIGNKTPEIDEVLQNLSTLGEERTSHFDPRSLQRETKKVAYTSVITGERSERTVSSPSAFEKVALAEVTTLRDPEIKLNPKKDVYQPMGDLLREYRIYTQPDPKKGVKNPESVRPEMPELASALFEEVQHLPSPIDQDVRYSIYGVLEQLTLPNSLKESLVEKMDSSGDLEHPFAYQLTRDIANRDPESRWIKTQQERREAMLQLLSGTNQELFENYDALLQESKGLVASDDPLSPQPGKIGMEIEFEKNKASEKVLSEYVKRTKKSKLNKNSILAEWQLDEDAVFDANEPEERVLYEMQKADYALEHNAAYGDSLISLSHWLKDYGSKLHSIHLHLDLRRHFNSPHLGNLFAEEVSGRLAVRPSDHHDTHEIRGLNLPRAEGTIHPGRIDDLVNLYISAAKGKNAIEATNGLSIDPDKDLSVKQMTWGHIVTHLEDPKGRLAALMSLHDAMALANVTPLSYANSVRREDTPVVADKLEGQFTAASDIKLLRLLRGYGNGDYSGIDAALKIREGEVAITSLGYDRSLLLERELIAYIKKRELKSQLQNRLED